MGFEGNRMPADQDRNPTEIPEEPFESYLGAGEVPFAQLQAYATEVQKTVALVRVNNTFDGWKELSQLAAYQTIDAGVSGELANRIEAIWNTGRTSDRMASFNQGLKKEVNTANRNADLMSKGIREEDLRMKRKENEGKKTAAPPPPANNGAAGGAPAAAASAVPAPDPTAATANTSHIEGKLELTEEYLTSLENRAKIKVNELKVEKLLDKSKSDFAGYITTLYTTGRFQQVIVAAQFYLKIFDQGDYPVAMANQVNVSLEKYRAVKGSIDVFRYKLDRNELVAATERLKDVFVACEFHPSVLSLERAMKEKVAAYQANVSKIENLIEARDFRTLETVLGETKWLAADFDSAKAMAMVNAVKLECKLRLGKAKLAAQQGDLKAAMDEFQSAAETWPSNPELQDKALTFFDTQDVKTQSLTDFDRFFEEGNYRAIFDKQLMFAPAMKDDKKRQDQLKTALEAIKNAEMASEKASAMMLIGDSIGAWETIELAAKDLPDDKKLNKLRADLSGRSAEFVSAINKARDAEARKDFGFGLSWYVNAQRQYPASRIANEAIERISKQLLGGEKTTAL
jgi:tetratricopeptide (TPR) repeat protein